MTSNVIALGVAFGISGCGPSFARVAHFKHGVYGGKSDACSPGASGKSACDICWLRSTFTDGDELPFASERLIGVGSVSTDSAPSEKYECQPEFEFWYGDDDWSWGAPRREALAVLDSLCSPTVGLYYDDVLQSYRRGTTVLTFQDELDTDGRLQGSVLDTDFGQAAHVVGCTRKSPGGARLILAIEALPDMFFVEAFGIVPRALLPVSYYRSAIARAFTQDETEIAPEYRFDQSSAERGPAADHFVMTTAEDGSQVRHEYYGLGQWYGAGERVGSTVAYTAYTAGLGDTLSAMFLDEAPPVLTSSTPPAETAARECSELETVEVIRRYRGLLDEEIITFEEFEAQKRRLLGEDVFDVGLSAEDPVSADAPLGRIQN